MEPSGPSTSADISQDSSTSHLDTCLMFASERGDIEEVRRLLHAGAQVSYLVASSNNFDINDIVYRSSAVSAAAQNGHFEIAIMLLNYEGLYSEKQGKESNPFYWSILAETLRNRSKITREQPLDYFGKPLELFEKSFHDRVWLISNMELMKYLLHAGADIDRKFQNGLTPLMTAVSQGKESVVRFLLAAGADPNIAGTNKVTSLIIAAESQSLGILQLLLENGANPNSPDPYRADELISYPLFWAISKGNLPHIRLLMQHGAVPNAVPEYSLYVWRLVEMNDLLSFRRRMTPLHMALYCNQPQIVHYFCEVGFLASCDVEMLSRVGSDWNMEDDDESDDASECQEFLHNWSSKSLPLVTLTFVFISNRIGFKDDRTEKLQTLNLPPGMKKRLMFKMTNSFDGDN